MRLCARGALRRRLLSAKSRAYFCRCRNSGFPLPASSGLLPARPTHALRTCYVCLLFDFYPLNLERIAVACSSGFPLPASSRLLTARPTHAVRCSRSFKTLVIRAPIAVLQVLTPKLFWTFRLTAIKQMTSSSLFIAILVGEGRVRQGKRDVGGGGLRVGWRGERG